ncbi:MAG: GNAT family protein [Steroidobacteraceae bacterium]
MIKPVPITLEGFGVRLEPMRLEHAAELEAAAADGRLWELRVTSVPAPGETVAYIGAALEGARAGQMLPWVVRDTITNTVVGSTRYHDIVAHIDRAEIGYTWYARRWQRTHVNPACKLLLLRHGFDDLGCAVIGLRTDIDNHASQRAIEFLGARKDGIIRHHALRRDGTVRDTVMYSILHREWPEIERRLLDRLQV